VSGTITNVSSPISVGRVIRRVFAIYAEQASLLVPVSALISVIAVVLDTLVRAGPAALSLLAFPIDIVSTVALTGFVVVLVAGIQDGTSDASVGELWGSVRVVLGQLILVGCVAALGEGIGLLLLVLPGLYLLTIWSVFAPVIVLERPAGLQALDRSHDLVRRSGWCVFGVILVLVVSVLALDGGVAFADHSSGTVVVLVVRVVVHTIVLPVSALASAVLYHELRSSTESNDTDT
jgi:hypothetical protein